MEIDEIIEQLIENSKIYINLDIWKDILLENNL